MEIEPTANPTGEHGSISTLQRVLLLESQLRVQAELLGPITDEILGLGLTRQLNVVELLHAHGFASLASAVSHIILHATMRREEGNDDGI